MIYLLLVLASVAHFEEFLLLSPLLRLSAHLCRALLVHAPVVEVASHHARLVSGALTRRLVHVHVMAFFHKVAHERISRVTCVFGHSFSCAMRIILNAKSLLLLKLFLLFFDKLQDQLFFINLIVGVDRVLLALLLHDEH